MMRLMRHLVRRKADALQRKTVLPLCQCVARRVSMHAPVADSHLLRPSLGLSTIANERARGARS